MEHRTGPAGRHALRVLLVEDSADDVELCWRIPKKSFPGVRCDVVRSAADFSRHIGASYYDVVLADYTLGTWTGLAAFNLMRKAGRSIPFILVTGVLGDRKATQCIKAGITDYVLKDYLERLPVAISCAFES